MDRKYLQDQVPPAKAPDSNHDDDLSADVIISLLEEDGDHEGRAPINHDDTSSMTSRSFGDDLVDYDSIRTYLKK